MVIIWGQCIGLNPVTGILQKDVSKMRFTKCSFQYMFAMTIAVAQIMATMLSIYRLYNYPNVDVLVEHIMALLSRLVHIMECQDGVINVGEVFVKGTSPWLYELNVPYDVWLGSILQNYVCESTWEVLREDYNRATKLIKLFDDVFSGLVLIAFTNDLFSVCLQLYNVLRKVVQSSQIIDKICPGHDLSLFRVYVFPAYVTYSTIYLVVRFLTLALVASRVHSSSSVALPVLYGVPTTTYCKEVERFQNQVKSGTVALSGLRFFYITRDLVLTVSAYCAFKLAKIWVDGNVTTLQLQSCHHAACYNCHDDKNKIKTQFISFQKAMTMVIIWGQFSGLNPVTGILQKDVSKIRFTKRSFQYVFALTIAFAQIIGTVLSIYKLYKHPNIGVLGSAVYLSTACLTTISFIRTAPKWPSLMNELSNCRLNEYIHPNVVKRCKIACAVYLGMGIVEHMMAILSRLVRILECHEGIVNVGEQFVKVMSPWLYELNVPYNVWLGIILQNYVSASTWQLLREDHNRAIKLVKLFDDVYSGLVLIAFANDMFSICIQLYNVVGKVIRSPELINKMCPGHDDRSKDSRPKLRAILWLLVVSTSFMLLEIYSSR
ncbi:hypothetical protein PYW08_014285 [Mythimna loreyi]|uniref:Uncharacterized protein n=1 Tax=Mythimna loreyi TaxID=667449 RepID=A0ACC2RBG5_9NEOP|nr:hypothetical protein PYW08_014285 [Mythimna loreyi]